MGDGSRFGIKISYVVQARPKGLLDAFVLGKKFINNKNVALILVTIFFTDKAKILEKSLLHKTGAKIFLKEVIKPEIMVLPKLQNKIFKIVEKPKNLFLIRRLQVIFFDKDVVKFSESLKPSKRGEVKKYILQISKNKKLNFEQIVRAICLT